MTTQTLNREDWLNLALAESLRPWFTERAGKEIPACHVSMGFPSKGALSLKSRSLGQAWDKDASTDGKGHIFISPTIAENSVRVLDVLAHEAVHITVGCEAGHKGPFRTVAKAIGLEGKMTATTAGAELTSYLESFVSKHGPLPSGAIVGGDKKKQGTRMIKATCPSCGYVIRTTHKWLEHAAPCCPDKDCDGHNEPMQIGD